MAHCGLLCAVVLLLTNCSLTHPPNWQCFVCFTCWQLAVGLNVVNRKLRCWGNCLLVVSTVLPQIRVSGHTSLSLARCPALLSWRIWAMEGKLICFSESYYICIYFVIIVSLNSFYGASETTCSYTIQQHGLSVAVGAYQLHETPWVSVCRDVQSSKCCDWPTSWSWSQKLCSWCVWYAVVQCGVWQHLHLA